MSIDSEPVADLDAGLDDLVSRDQRALACPYPIFAELREKSPVHFSEKLGAWVCTRYDDILAVLHDTDRFSSSLPTGPSPLGKVLAAGMEELRNDPAMTETYDRSCSSAPAPRFSSTQTHRSTCASARQSTERSGQRGFEAWSP